MTASLLPRTRRFAGAIYSDGSQATLELADSTTPESGISILTYRA